MGYTVRYIMPLISCGEALSLIAAFFVSGKISPKEFIEFLQFFGPLDRFGVTRLDLSADLTSPPAG